MIVALVLAAGRSERMGSPKATLALRGETFVQSILATLAGSGVPHAKVVLGHDAEAVRRTACLAEELVVINDDWPRGMLSSIRAGLRAMPRETEAFLLWPVDHPLVSRDTVERLVEAFRAGAGPIVVPRYRGRRGHPVIFDARLSAELEAAPDAVGAKAVVHAHAGSVASVDVDDPGVLVDIDTPDVYEAEVRRSAPSGRP